ncbi:MAG: hypothetical protein IKB94_03455 [Clostridia bacterium]|nr:hypothetical protein [Clostridia bacterium]
MKTFKRLLSLTLCLVMVFSCTVPITLATDEKGKCSCDHCPSIVLPGLFQSKALYLDDQGNDMLKSDGTPYAAPFFMEATGDIVKLALEEALVPLGSLLITQQDKENRCAEAIADVLGKVLVGNLALDSTGHPVKNVSADKYTTSLAGLRQDQREYALSKVPLDAYVDIAGLDHLYFLSYLHTGNIMDIAAELYELIQIAKKETGHDKVNLVPLSQGGSVENALMQYYIDNGLDFSEDVNRVCYVVPAADGAYILGDIYRYGFIDEPDALYGYMLPSLLGEDNSWLAYLINLLLRIFPNADLNNILDTAVHTLIEDYLEYSTCLWALIPSYDYPTCREMYLSDEEDAEIRRQTDWYYNAQVNSRKYILDAQADGVEFFDIVCYNKAVFKIFDSWDKVNGDGVIHTDSESFGATTVSVDVPLAKDYVQANTYCTAPGKHNHIDDERLIDASTGIMCERTFYFKDAGHDRTAANDVIMRLAVRILTDNTFSDVYSDPAFPQFNFARDSMEVIKLYNQWNDFDTSALSKEDAQEFTLAKEALGEVIETTYLPTEDFDAAAERFENIVFKIENGKEKSDNALLNILATVLKYINRIMLKYFSGKGYSELLK